MTVKIDPCKLCSVSFSAEFSTVTPIEDTPRTGPEVMVTVEILGIPLACIDTNFPVSFRAVHEQPLEAIPLFISHRCKHIRECALKRLKEGK